MRLAFSIAIAALSLTVSLAACSKSDESMNEHSGAYDFKPPTAQGLKEFRAALGQRFNNSDRDHNGVLDASDFPRRPERLKHWDVNNDGKVPREEFEAADLARFAAADADKDQILTSAERVRARWSEAAAPPAIADKGATKPAS